MIGTVTADENGAWSFTPETPLADGDHSLTVTSTDAAARFLAAPGDAFLVLPRPDAEAVAALAPGRVHEIASSARLVVRLDRLFGDRSPFEDGLVVVTNRTAHMAGKADTR